MKRVLRLTRWALREPAYWRVSLLLLLVLVFSLASGVIRPGGSPDDAPESVVATALDSTAALVVLDAYPFLFALLSILATLTIAAQRESGAFASLQTLGYRRGEIFLSQVLAVLVLALVPALLAFLTLPPLVEPRLLGNLAALYPFAYWASMPRLLLAVLFLTLFASSFALLIRRVPTAFGAMVTFFFVGWYLEGPLGTYRSLAPSHAFTAAYGLGNPIPGLPFKDDVVFAFYVVAALVVFLIALAYASLRGELE